MQRKNLNIVAKRKKNMKTNNHKNKKHKPNNAKEEHEPNNMPKKKMDIIQKNINLARM